MFSIRNGRSNQPFADQALDLATHLSRLIGMRCEDEQHDPAGVHALDDRRAPLGAGRDVSRRDPAPDSPLQATTGVSPFLVFRQVADENFVRRFGASLIGLSTPIGWIITTEIDLMIIELLAAAKNTT